MISSRICVINKSTQAGLVYCYVYPQFVPGVTPQLGFLSKQSFVVMDDI